MTQKIHTKLSKLSKLTRYSFLYVLIMVPLLSGCRMGILNSEPENFIVCLGGVQYYKTVHQLAPVVDDKTLNFKKCGVHESNRRK